MEQLDLVHNTFVNLERNYKRSNRSRSEYVKEKFGGNISIAAFLILNALSAEEFTDPEDIRKFSEIRDIFEKIKENQDRLDSLTSFDFDEDQSTTDVFSALSSGQRSGTGFEVCEQATLYRYGALHYDARPDEVRIVPIRLEGQETPPPYVELFSPGMLTLFSQMVPGAKLGIGGLLKRENLGLSFKPTKDVVF